MAQTGEIKDPFSNFNFLVEIDGIARAGFQEASGLDSAIDVIDYREGGENIALRKLPGMTKFTNIVLKRGVTDDLELYEWHQRAVRGEIERKNGSIVVLSNSGQEVARWNFVRAWPAKWTGPTFNAEGTDVAVETFELAHEGIERA